MRKLSYVFLAGVMLAGCSNSNGIEENGSGSSDNNTSTYAKAVEQGKLALANGDIDKALASFELALDEKPSDSKVKKYVAQLQQTEEIASLIEEKKYKAAKVEADEILESETLLSSVKGQIESLQKKAKTKQSRAIALKKEKAEESQQSNTTISSQVSAQPRVNVYQTYSNQAASIVSNYDNPAANMDGTTQGSEDRMINAENARYTKWDALLNDIYGTLKTKLSTSEFSYLQTYQRQWIKDRDNSADEVSNYADYYSSKVAHAMALADLTKERCYELINDYSSELQR